MANLNFVDHALALAKRGFHVFPLKANSKEPAIDKFPVLATTDEAQIREWWGKRPYCNIGISTTLYNGGHSGLLAVDVDNKGDKKGNDEIFKLELEGKEFPGTFTQKTPTGGRHLIYRVNAAVKQSAGRIAPGIDTRSKGGYVVGAGSSLDGRLYTIEPGDDFPTPAPAWLLQNADDRETPKIAVIPEKLNAPRAITRAEQWLKTAPVAVQGSSGDQVTFKTANKVKDFGVNEEDCFTLLFEWNLRCQPPWAPSDLRTKVRNAYNYGANPIGIDAPETQFKPIPAAPPSGSEFYLDQINKEYALVFVDGFHFILHETTDKRGEPKLVFLSEVSFKRKFSTQTIVEGKGRPRTWAENWLDWPGRRQFDGVCFAPEQDPGKGYYNLWKGFLVKPVPYEKASLQAQRGFDMFIEHTLQNVCNGSEDLFDWLMSYFAHLIQMPYDRPLTAVVFRGRKGTGKNAFIDRIGKLLGEDHYAVVHNSRYLTSNFNGHLESCLCLVLDEAFWSGEKSAEGTLKGLITERRILIERKGREVYKVDNLARTIIIGNEDWLVPASEDERRYAVFDIGEGRRKDNAFFEEMRTLMDSRGGNSVLLHFLKTFDISKANYNTAPDTQGLYDQKVSSQTPMFDWWLDCLEEGRIVCADFGDIWPRDVNKESFRQAFQRYARDRGVGKWSPSAKSFGLMLKKCLPSAQLDKQVREGEKRTHVYRLPPLEEAREEWDKRMNHKTKWEEV